MLFMKIGENSYRSNRMYRDTRTNRKYSGALKRADRNDFGFGGRDPMTYEQAEKGKEVVRQSKVQMKGIRQRWNYEAPKDQAKFRAQKQFIMEKSNPKGSPVVPYTSPAKRGQYIQQNWKRFL